MRVVRQPGIRTVGFTSCAYSSSRRHSAQPSVASVTIYPSRKRCARSLAQLSRNAVIAVSLKTPRPAIIPIAMAIAIIAAVMAIAGP